MIWSPIRCTGLSAFIAPWNTTETSLPTDRLHLLLRERQEVLAAEVDASGDGRAVGEQARDRERRRRLAAGRLSGETERLSLREIEVDARDRLDRPALRRRSERGGRGSKAAARSSALLQPWVEDAIAGCVPRA